MIAVGGRLRWALGLASLAAASCFTDYEIGGTASEGATSGGSTTGQSVTDDTGGTDSADGGSGDAGSGGGDSVGACDPSPAGAGPCPARCTGGCALDTCTIACDSRSPCDDTDIVCPQGWPCVVLCNGPDACKEATVHCSDGPCELQCSEPKSCDGVVLMCGAQACNAWCSDDEPELDQLDCGPSCSCQSNCTISDSGEGSEGSGSDGSGSSD